jgi:hypothetical protein
VDRIAHARVFNSLLRVSVAPCLDAIALLEAAA